MDGAFQFWMVVVSKVVNKMKLCPYCSVVDSHVGPGVWC